MEQNLSIEKAAALALLDRGIKFKIPAPALMILFGKKTISITVKRLYLGTLIHLSALEQLGEKQAIAVTEKHTQVLEGMDAKPESLSYTDIVDNRKVVCRQVAACLLNSRLKIALFSKLLGRYLRRSCTADQIQELIMWLFAYGRPEAFTNTTKLIRKMKLMSSRS